MNENEVTSYPLTWPQGWPRAKVREGSRFRASTVARAIELIQLEVDRLGADHLTISTNVKLKSSGLPFSSYSSPEDPGAAVYFVYKKRGTCLACDKFKTVSENLWSIGNTLNALRSIERWGSSDMLERAFTGFAGLPAPKSKRPWRDVLDAHDCREFIVHDNYRFFVKKYHPDNPETGDVEKFHEIQLAYFEFKQEKGTA